MSDRAKKPYPIFHEPRVLTDDTPAMGIPGRMFDALMTSGFVERQQRGDEILRQRDRSAAEALGIAATIHDALDGADDFCDAEILSLAKQVFGRGETARSWLLSKAYGLNWQRPAELLRTPEGREAVKVYLDRLHYSVHC